jgi:glycosyltransferase involved in cell wall biosynthesis
MRRLPEPDVIYAHFLFPGGRAAAKCARLLGHPCFVAHGDHQIDPWYLRTGRGVFADVCGVIAVSEPLRNFCTDVFEIEDEKIAVIPNAVDRQAFFPRDRLDARRRLSLPLDADLVAFVGRFVDAKGPLRVLEAIHARPNTLAMLIGDGPLAVGQSALAFRGVVDHRELPWYLSAADIFVLPTTGEGCSNAILEAMACGLPIVSSNGTFNDGILRPSFSIRVDPMSVPEISSAIASVLDHPGLRREMGKRAAEWSAQFSIERRATTIADWMAFRTRVSGTSRRGSRS